MITTILLIIGFAGLLVTIYSAMMLFPFIGFIGLMTLFSSSLMLINEKDFDEQINYCELCKKTQTERGENDPLVIYQCSAIENKEKIRDKQ